MSFIVAVDFDGTIVDHQFPSVGPPVPGAFEWLKRFEAAGAKLILWTMRSPGRESLESGTLEGDVLQDAVDFCKANGIEFWGINENPDQHTWTASPKAYAHVLIDDAAFGCPLRGDKRMGGRPMVDWDLVGPAVLAMIEQAKAVHA